jgi:patatin-related protein
MHIVSEPIQTVPRSLVNRVEASDVSETGLSGNGGPPALMKNYVVREPAMADHDTSNCQDIRVAVVMNGGVSLAVWISGVTLQLYELATARRSDHTTYRPLLDLLDADARVDVIAGTSAGGINGAFLALGLNRNRDLKLLRDVWRNVGGLDRLLRDPLSKNPPSMLRGDDYFLPEIQNALTDLAKGSRADPDGGRPVELILTGTLWKGRSTSFTDDMAATITEVDHDATFRFQSRSDTSVPRVCGDLDSDEVIAELAAAARCTASFPGAFEPHWVRVEGTDDVHDTRWSSTAGRANFASSQYVVDGGILLNKPIRPVLEAIYQQTAEYQVRRLLAYVAPGPAEAPASAAAVQNGDVPGPLPAAPAVLLAVLTRLRATDSVSRELTEIRTRNAESSARRRARDRFAAAMTDVAQALSEKAWDGYRDVRIEHAARTIGQLVAVGQTAEDKDRWSEKELTGLLQAVIKKRSANDAFVPHGPLREAVSRTGDQWDWGVTTAQRLGDMTVDMLKRALWLAPMGSDARKAIVAARHEVSETLRVIRTDRRGLDQYWSTAASGRVDGIAAIPPRVSNRLDAALNQAELANWLGILLNRWERQGHHAGRSRRTVLHQQVLDLACQLADTASHIAYVVEHPNLTVDPDKLHTSRLASLYAYLLAPTDVVSPGPCGFEVLARMLRLDVVQLAYEGASQDVEQEVELVKFAARRPECITGMQVNHFGAFYRASWRVNDWIHGRMDGAAHVVRTLLSPERLRQRAALLPVEELLRQIEACAVPGTATASDEPWLRRRWESLKPDVESYLTELSASRAPANGDDPRLVGRLVEAVARPTELAILREDLSELAEAIQAEGDEAPSSSRSWLTSYLAKGPGGQPDLIPAEDLFTLWGQAAKIGKEKIRDDAGDTLARTASHLAAVTVNAMGAVTRPKAVTSILKALRGYTLMVWAMVAFMTSPSKFGRRAVELAVAAGGSMLALAILVPAIPLAIILTGVLLVVAGVSAAALRSDRAKGVGRRLGVVGLIVAASLGGYLYWDWRANGLAAGFVGALAKIGVFLLIVLLGWWISTARPGPRDETTKAGSREAADRRRVRKMTRSGPRK